ncbi:MAG: phosphoglycolate phosphatase [Tahibacter sp.]
MNWSEAGLSAVFFDLDGTLVDSAPDLVAAMRRLCLELGAPQPDAQGIRGVVSKGGRAMLRRGLPGIDDAEVELLLPRFLDLYANALSVESSCYDGIAELLASIDGSGLRWGIVTNKPGWLARPLIEQMGLAERCVAMVAGDTLAVRKPDPAPLLHACAQAGVDPRDCVYVGDDRRDVEAGRAAGMPTIVAAWGYLDGEDPFDWNADLIVASPRELIAKLARSVA